MDENDEPNKPTDGTPAPEVAQLLKILEIQSAAQHRRAAAGNPLQTSSFRYGSLLVIVIFTFGSLGLMEWFLSSLPKPAHTTSSLATPQPVKTGTAAGMPKINE
jgi:hypothetical protein